MNGFWETIVTIITASAGVAIVALLVSKKSDTSNILKTASSGWAGILSVAEAPVAGYQGQPTNYFG